MNNNPNNKHLEYSAIRSEANNKFTISLQVPSQFKDKEIDVNFNPTDNKTTYS